MIDLTKYELKPIYKDYVLDHFGLVPKAEPAKSGNDKGLSLQKCGHEAQPQQEIAKARIDEWNRLISITRINGERVINQATYSLALDRIAELSQTLKELEAEI